MIGDGEHRQAHPAPASKQALREMLAQAVANTPGAVPVSRNTPIAAPRPAMGSSSANPDQSPSAYQVAVAIVAASRELGCDPELIALGVTSRGGRHTDHSIPRARAYAAWAIRKVYPNNGATAISRWVGAKTPGNYLSVMDAQRRSGANRWFDEAIFRRIVLRLQATPREA